MNRFKLYAMAWRKWVFKLTLTLVVAQLVLILISWLLAAAMPDLAVKSLISAGGIRWFFANFSAKIATPALVWLILVAVAVSSVVKSGLYHASLIFVSSQRGTLTSQQLFALRMSVAFLVVEAIAIILLTALPHAVLLSVTGELFPSSFSLGLVPLTAFVCTTVSVVYGLLSGTLRTLYDVGECLSSSGEWLMPLLVLYVFLAQFVVCCCYVFMFD